MTNAFETMEQRDRASGWKHAKLSGHTNEERVKELLDKDSLYRSDFMKRIGLPNETIKCTSIGGLHEKKVPGVLGRKTKSKTDLKIICDSGKVVTVSIKKSLAGQVYFVSAEVFIKVFKLQFKVEIPTNVQRAIRLFWASAEDAPKIIEQYDNPLESNNYNLQIRHRSLNATTLKAYNETLYKSMLDWFSQNAYKIAKLAFTMGAAKDSKDWSEYVWYINLLGENEVDRVFHIEEICQAANNVAGTETYYGDKNGGTTIQLPYGFVEWHQAKMQFHHSYDKLCSLTATNKLFKDIK